MSEFEIKDSGQRETKGQMLRDTEEGKLDYSNLFVWFEPMGTRYVTHMTKGRAKYEDIDGKPNWTYTPITEEQLARFQRSLDRHFKAYRMGETDEDHAAGIMFNLNGAEYVKERLDRDGSDSGGSEQEVGLDESADFVAHEGANLAAPDIATRLYVREACPHHSEPC